MPRWLSKTPNSVLRRVLCASGCRLDDWHAEISQTGAEFFVRTATWRLAWLEQEMGLPPRPNATLDERRDRIIARMRSWQLPTPSMIQRLANSFSNGQVEPIMDFEGHTITIRFVSVVGVPANILDMQAEILRILPARLDVKWEFRYLTWGETRQSGVQWCQLLTSGITWEQLRSSAMADLPTDVECPPAGPTVLNVRNTTSTTGMVVYWDTEPASPPTGYVEYGPTTAYGHRQDDWWAYDPTTFRTDHGAELLDLDPGATLHWRIAQPGGPEAGVTYTADRVTVLPTPANVTNVQVTNATPTGGTMSFTSNVPGKGSVEYGFLIPDSGEFYVWRTTAAEATESTQHSVVVNDPGYTFEADYGPMWGRAAVEPSDPEWTWGYSDPVQIAQATLTAPTLEFYNPQTTLVSTTVVVPYDKSSSAVRDAAEPGAPGALKLPLS